MPPLKRKIYFETKQSSTFQKKEHRWILNVYRLLNPLVTHIYMFIELFESFLDSWIFYKKAMIRVLEFHTDLTL